MAKKFGIWLSYNNQEEGFELPILPPLFEEARTGDASNSEVLGLGKIAIIKAPNLATYSIESFFPANNYHFINSSVVLEPTIYVETIKRWMRTKRPIRLVYVGDTFEVNQAVRIASFNYSHVGGIIGDINFKLELQEYKFYSAKEVKPIVVNGEEAVVKGTEGRSDDRVKPSTYTLKAGDTLWKVAKLILNDGSRYREIQKLNGITDAQTKTLQVGRVIKLP